MILYTARYTKGVTRLSSAERALITIPDETKDNLVGIFKPFCTKNYMPYYYNRLDRRTKETYISVSFTTMQLPCFNEFREMFYVLNTKIVPINIYDLLTPRGLAFWIMDNGSRQGAGLYLSTYSFSNEDMDRLMFTLQDKFGLKCSIHYNRDNKPIIYIFKEYMDNKKSLVSPYFIEEMLYKLGL